MGGITVLLNKFRICKCLASNWLTAMGVLCCPRTNNLVLVSFVVFQHKFQPFLLQLISLVNNFISIDKKVNQNVFCFVVELLTASFN